MQKAIDYLNEKIAEFVGDWEPGHDNKLPIDLEYLSSDGVPVLETEELDVILADFEELYGMEIEGWTLTLEFPYRFLEDRHKRRTGNWKRGSALEHQEWLDSRGVI